MINFAGYASGSYGEQELKVFASALEKIPKNGTVVEIGCQYGSSTCVLMSMAKQWKIYCIDPFATSEIATRFLADMRTFNVRFALLMMESKYAVDYLPNEFDFIHVDGDHTEAGVTLDCELYLPRLFAWGYAIAVPLLISQELSKHG